MNTEQKILIGDIHSRIGELPDQSVHMIMSSPPYFGVRKYLKEHDPEKDLEFGSEKVPDCGGWAVGENCGGCYVCKTVLLFREFRRVLRDDGLIAWNLGDSFWGAKALSELKKGDQIGIPFRVYLALQKDGWYTRQQLIWAKGISGKACEFGWSGSCMPESTKDRFSNSHEHIFLFAKNRKYFFDHVAAQEDSVYCEGTREHREKGTFNSKWADDSARVGDEAFRHISNKRNRRSVFTSEKNQFLGAHTAVYPVGLITPLILACTSEMGCCVKCGSPIKRHLEVVGTQVTAAMKAAGCNDLGEYAGTAQKDFEAAQAQNASDSKRRILESMSKIKKTTWVKTCTCENAGEPVPCTILDPFCGSGTTLSAAKMLGRNAVGIDLNPSYEVLMLQRLASTQYIPLSERSGAVSEACEEPQQLTLPFEEEENELLPCDESGESS